jgi:hypothetical protein
MQCSEGEGEEEWIDDLMVLGQINWWWSRHAHETDQWSWSTWGKKAGSERKTASGTPKSSWPGRSSLITHDKQPWHISIVLHLQIDVLLLIIIIELNKPTCQVLTLKRKAQNNKGTALLWTSNGTKLRASPAVWGPMTESGGKYRRIGQKSGVGSAELSAGP